MNARALALASMVALSSCPLPIVVRCATGADCAAGEACVEGQCAPGGSGGSSGGSGGNGAAGGTGGGSAVACQYDWQCDAGTYCEGDTCTPGGKIGDRCDFSSECGPGLCDLTLNLCATRCVFDSSCRSGYDCAPDSTCVPRCQGPVPAIALGRSCRDSVECECGYCADDGTRTRCHQPCRFDTDCDGGVGTCRDLSGKKVCRLP
ncbi:MAG: hypothetical protein JNK82_14190 [Myxococcaceae bacterium]|nr:hypothetical protein [Myxococcaceae bacterium]